MGNDYGWRGMKVRNTDGRTGIIKREHADFMGVELTIEDTSGARSKVTLNATLKDSGEAGWSWLSTDFMGGPAWLPLGDMNTFGVVRDLDVASA